MLQKINLLITLGSCKQKKISKIKSQIKEPEVNAKIKLSRFVLFYLCSWLIQVLLLKISGKFNISLEITDSLNTSRFYLLKVSC